MDNREVINDVLVNLFNEILRLEEEAIITDKYKDISNNDMHIIDAIGVKEPKNMGTVAKAMTVTMGTLTTAINNLVKKGYVTRVRSAEDKRVVLISLTDKGRSAYEKHADFHRRMVQTVMDGFQGEELDIKTRALEKLR